jgi:hypothetical protein
LAAIRDALDRAGVGAKQAVEVGVELKPYEQVLTDIVGVARITQAESRARQGLLPDRPALAPPEPIEVVEAELVDEPDSRSGSGGVNPPGESGGSTSCEGWSHVRRFAA